MSNVIASVGALLLEQGLDHFYLLHLTYRRDAPKYRDHMWAYAKENNLVGIDVHKIVNRPWTEYMKDEREKLVTPIWQGQFDMFYGMGSGDCVVIADGQKYLLGVGLVNSANEFREELVKGVFFRHVRRVHWKWKGRVLVQPRLDGFVNSIRRVGSDSPYWRITQLRLA